MFCQILCFHVNRSQMLFQLLVVQLLMLEFALSVSQTSGYLSLEFFSLDFSAYVISQESFTNFLMIPLISSQCFIQVKFLPFTLTLRKVKLCADFYWCF